MKVGFVLPNTLGNSGGIKVILEYANEFNKRGYECEVIYPLIPSNYRLYKLKNIKQFIKFIGTIVLNIFNYNSKKFNEKYKYIKFRKVCKLSNLKSYEYEYDDLYATAWDTYYYIKDLNVNKKYFVQSYETWAGPEEFVKKTYEDENFKYFVITKYLKEMLHVRHNIISEIVYTPINMISNTKLDKDYSTNIYGVIFRKEKNKNFDIIIKFLNENKSYRNNFVCLARNLPQKYKKYFKKVYDGNNSVEKFYKEINIFIMTSKHEGFSLPIMEAILFENLLISTKTGILNDLHDIKYFELDNDKEMKDLMVNSLKENIIEIEKINKIEKEKIIKWNKNIFEEYKRKNNWDKNIEKLNK